MPFASCCGWACPDSAPAVELLGPDDEGPAAAAGVDAEAGAEGEEDVDPLGIEEMTLDCESPAEGDDKDPSEADGWKG